MFKYKIKLLIIIFIISFFQTSNNMFRIFQGIKNNYLKNLKSEKKNNKNNNLIKSIAIEENKIFIEDENVIKNNNKNSEIDKNNEIKNNENNINDIYKKYEKFLLNFDIESFETNFTSILNCLNKNRYEEPINTINKNISFLKEEKNKISKISNENKIIYLRSLKKNCLFFLEKEKQSLDDNLIDTIDRFLIFNKLNTIYQFINDIEIIDKKFLIFIYRDELNKLKK